MEKLLKDLTTVNVGTYAKSAVSGNVVYLQPGMFDTDGGLRDGLKPDILMDDLASKHILLKGDVLLSAKGNNNFIIVYNPVNDAPAVASSAFLVVRAKDEGPTPFLPEYLAWYLSHPRTQLYLKTQARGTSIPSISKDTLQNLAIPLPPLAVQHRILNIQRLRDQQKTLVGRLEALRDQLVQHSLLTKAQQ